jgi:hypothetical protein
MRRALTVFGVLALCGGLSTGLADNHDAGCVSCHVDGAAPDGGDFRVNAVLAKLGHRIGPEKSEIIPTDCNRCHQADDTGTAGPLRRVIHSIHYEAPEENLFMTEYGGNCRSCHDMNAAIGVAVIRSAERNWVPKDVKPRYPFGDGAPMLGPAAAPVWVRP